MEFRRKKLEAQGMKLYIKIQGKVVGRARVYFMNNDLHEERFALLEDVFVDKEHRGKGLGRKLINRAIEEARQAGCYKLIATSRYARDKVHQMYENFGFTDYGKEFRMNLG
jgi:GNAT superfamily N-acetyltransferase